MFESKVERAERKWQQLDVELSLAQLELQRTGTNLDEVKALTHRWNRAFADWEDKIRRHGGDASAWANFEDARERRQRKVWVEPV